MEVYWHGRTAADRVRRGFVSRRLAWERAQADRPPPSDDVDADVAGDEVIRQLGNRRYRVRSLSENLAVHEVKADVLAMTDQGLYSIRRGTRYGSDAWVLATAAQLGLPSTLRPRGWPRKSS